MTQGRQEQYWDGGTWVYHSEITNGAGGAGDQTVEIVPGVGNEFELLYGMIYNLDTVGRLEQVAIEDDDDNILSVLGRVTLSANHRGHFPIMEDAETNSVAAVGNRFILGGGMVLQLKLSDVAASQNAQFICVARIRGGVPTVTEAGASTPTITINTEKVL